jgi:23S rRNA U2552 (ribose-2'-O)-methylase RlmE/FtsJ
MHIYSLQKGQPVVVNMPTNPARIVVTDGYHITGPVQISYSPQRTHYFTIACVVENDVLVGGGIFMMLLFFMGLTSGLFVLQLLSMSPIFYLLFLYYVKRKEFIQIRRLK